MSLPLTRTQKRQKETKARIFREAMKLFQEKGFDNTTVAEITEAADIGKGTFFTYFPTKEALFRQPGELAMERMSLAAQEGLAAGASGADLLKQVLTSSVEWHEANKEITLQMSKLSFAFSMDESSSNKGKLLELLTQLIHTGQARGEFNSRINTQNTALVLAGMYFTVIAFWAHSEEPSLRAQMEASLDVLLQGLLAHE